jgi:hypothetical protein
MKTLSKLIAAAFIGAALFFTTNVNAQTTDANAFKLALSVEGGAPTGVAKLGANFALGGNARLQYGITNSLAVTFAAGGYHFFPKMIPGQDSRYQGYGELPIKAGIKEFFIPNVYVAAEAGVAFEKLEQGWGPHRLALAPGVGYANKKWDVGVHYESFSRQEDHLGFFGLRVAYGLGL